MESTQLAKKRTQFANQRTYLSYIRTGFTLAGIAGVYQKTYLLLYGILMIVTSSYQYYAEIKKINIPYTLLDIIPLFYSALSILVLYLQFYKK